MSTEPFKNVQYYYPYAENKIGNTYLHREAYDNQRSQGKAHLYKYSYEEDKDNLDLMFASMDDPQQTMDSILNYIISNQGVLEDLMDGTIFWMKFKSIVKLDLVEIRK